MEKTVIRFSTLILLAVVLIGAFFRFYKLDWGQGLFTHPDEYHIAISVNQLSFPGQMNPNFFSYGTVTIYLIYFTKLLLSLSPFLLGRFYSALFSTLTLIFIYKISRLFMNNRYSLLAAFLAAITPGIIQQAHFATPESNLIFFLFGSLFFLLRFNQSKKLLFLFLSSLFLGLSLGVKVSSAILFPIILFSVFHTLQLSVLTRLKFALLSLLSTIITFFIADPYVLLDWTHFWSSFTYESSLARGLIPVFYTRQFIDTPPIIFQLTKILPYTLGPALLISGLLGFFLLAYQLFKKDRFFTSNFLFLASFLSLFLFNSLLFAKWTRFISPTFPFFAIFSAYLFYQLKSLKVLKHLQLPILVLILFWALAFFSIYRTSDVRHTASHWIESSLTPGSAILVEGGNMVDVPLAGDFRKASLDFYDLENSPAARQKTAESLAEADYFILESRRVFLNHSRLPSQYPKLSALYRNLFQGSAGFSEVKKFTSYPRLEFLGWRWEIPDEEAEETWSVFDHPVIRVFQKNAKLTKDDYAKLFEN